MISAISVFNLKPCSSLPRAEQSRCREREREGEREVCARAGKARPRARAAVPASQKLNKVWAHF